METDAKLQKLAKYVGLEFRKWARSTSQGLLMGLQRDTDSLMSKATTRGWNEGNVNFSKSGNLQK